MNTQQRNQNQRHMFAAWSSAQASADEARTSGDGNAWQARSWEAQCAMRQWMNAAGMAVFNH